MERRHSKRISFNLNSKIIIEGKTYEGRIENVSEDGIEYLMTSLSQVSEDFIPKKIIELNFQISSGETLNLNCEVIWFKRILPDDKKLNMGMKIIDPPAGYKEFMGKWEIQT